MLYLLGPVWHIFRLARIKLCTPAIKETSMLMELPNIFTVLMEAVSIGNHTTDPLLVLNF